LTSARGGWSRITIHHSAKYSKEIGTPSSLNVAGAIKDIQTVHRRDEGYGDIGYHFLIDPAGRIWQGRLLDWQGAHAGGENNVANIGICLFGNFNTERPDPRALAALEKLVDALCERHDIARSRVFGHRQLRSTECPGDALMAWVSRYAAGATH
jgi:N-acetyl-anhydromuramyl-L-alanine amidase AmpD